MLNASIKRVLSTVAPKAADSLQRRWARRHVRRLERQIGLTRVRDTFVERHGFVVQGGLFRGMNYVDRAVGSVALPKLIGSYEAELYPWLHDAIKRPYRRVVDIGCAEGYYAVGLARAIAGCEILAYDTDPAARRLCGDMARLNGVGDRVQIFGACDASELDNHVGANCLVICDCEGFEVELLNPTIAPALLQTDILVELHDHLRPEATQMILERFASSHHCSLIAPAERSPADYPCLDFLAECDRPLALSEMRDPRQRWATLEAKRHAA